MDDMRSLSMEDMEKVSGGNSKVIRNKSAIVRSGAGDNYSVVRTLDSGTVVSITGTVTYNDRENKTWYEIISPVYGWVTRYDIGV